VTDDIINELSYFITNEARMPAGLTITVIDHIESLENKIEQLYAEINELRLQVVTLSFPKKTYIDKDITPILRSFTDNKINIHYENCWMEHPMCAVHFAADVIEGLNDKIGDMMMLMEQDSCEIDQLREQVKVLKEAVGEEGRANRMTFLYERSQEEVQQLKSALALAVGELSTHKQYAVYSPEQLLNEFLGKLPDNSK
jgi:uncharacterized protein YggU (UPF0235/DUF167 family)